MSATCSAEIDKSRIAIGGIQPGNTPNYVKSIYGNPDKIEARYVPNGGGARIPKNSTIYTWYYGNSFEIEILNNEIVLDAISKDNNGLKTPDGITVGMRSNVLYEKYGIPDELETIEKENATYFSYYGRSDISALVFKLNNDIITSIVVFGYY